MFVTAARLTETAVRISRRRRRVSAVLASHAVVGRVHADATGAPA